jgi:CSLREA domain-containing protein
MKKPPLGILLASLLLGTMSLAVFPLPVEAGILVVNTTDDLDDGQCDVNHCSLREAINAANANSGSDSIRFDIPGSGSASILLTTALPPISDDFTFIDGTSEPDYAGTPIVNISPDEVIIDVGLYITSNGSEIRGLGLAGFGNWPEDLLEFDWIHISGGAIKVSGGHNAILDNVIRMGVRRNSVGVHLSGAANNVRGNSISGCRIAIHADHPNNRIMGNNIGPAPDGSAVVTNFVGVIIDGGADNTIIGGAASGEGNVISANKYQGIRLFSSSNTIQGNLIGVDSTGTVAMPNGAIGIEVGGSHNLIGGSAPGQGNVISGNDIDGIFISSTDIVIQGNLIGTDTSGSILIPNHGNGINVSTAYDIVIGGSTPETGNRIMGNLGNGIAINNYSKNGLFAGNVIAENHLFGIAIYQGDFESINNTITQNSIYANGQLGISISGINEIDYPVLDTGLGSTIEGTACNLCKLEIFLADPDPSGLGEGKEFLADGYADANGHFNIPVDGLGICKKITATATDPDGSTSEFSKNIRANCLIRPPDFMYYSLWAIIIAIFTAIAWRLRRTRPRLPAWSIPISGLAGGLLFLAFFTLLPFAKAEPVLQSICGNGLVEPGELCDGNDLTMCLEGQVCENCKCITYLDQCGNGVVDSGEQCDGDDLHMCLSGQVCENCKCITYLPMCGNGVVEQGEQCDGDDLTMCLEGQVCENCRCVTYEEAEPENDICVYEALQNSNCRASDYPESDLVETLMEGDSADLIALNSEYTHGLFELENGKQCWVWLGLMGGDENPFGNCPVEIVDPPEAPRESACSSDLDERECIAAGGEWTEGMAAPYCACPE